MNGVVIGEGCGVARQVAHGKAVFQLFSASDFETVTSFTLGFQLRAESSPVSSQVGNGFFLLIFSLPPSMRALGACRWAPVKEAEMRAQSLFKTSPDGGIYPPLTPKAFYAKFKYALQKRLLPIWL